MRSLQVQEDWDDDDAHARVRPAAPVSAAVPTVEAWVPCARWSDGRPSVNWPCAGAAIAFSAALLATLVTANVINVQIVKRDPTVVKLLEVPPEPPEIAPPPEQKVVPVENVKPVVVAPKPIIEMPPIAPQPMQTVAEPPPVAVAVVAPPSPKPALAGPVSITDLSTSLRVGKPPKIPIESRRLKEQGTVVIALVVSTTGNVTDASVYRSSGFPRLDKAALEAVRKFLYKPYVLNGVPVSVRTTVTFPFKLVG